MTDKLVFVFVLFNYPKAALLSLFSLVNKMLVNELATEDREAIRVSSSTIQSCRPCFNFNFCIEKKLQNDISSLYAVVTEAYKEEWEKECAKQTYTECPDIPDVVTQVYAFYCGPVSWILMIEL